MKSKSIFAVLVTALAIACNLKSGSGEPLVPLEVSPPGGTTRDHSLQVTAAPTRVHVRGIVVDETHSPIMLAAVRFAEQQVSTGPSGAFDLVVMYGPVAYAHTLVVTNGLPHLRIVLPTLSKPVDVDATGGSVTLPGATLVFAAGPPTTVSAA